VAPMSVKQAGEYHATMRRYKQEGRTAGLSSSEEGLEMENKGFAKVGLPGEVDFPITVAERRD
jgi:hypothetical protein